MSFDGDLYPTAGATSVMSVKGDLVRYDSERERYGIGSTGQVLSVTAGLPAWATLTTADSVLTTQGDVLYESASGLARLGFGTSGDVLTTKGTGANPVWETPSGGFDTTKTTSASLSAHFTTTSSSFVTVTGMEITTVNKTGSCFASATGTIEGDGGNFAEACIADDGTPLAYSQQQNGAISGGYATLAISAIVPTNASDISTELKSGGGTAELKADTSTATFTTTLLCWEIYTN